MTDLAKAIDIKNTLIFYILLLLLITSCTTRQSKSEDNQSLPTRSLSSGTVQFVNNIPVFGVDVKNTNTVKMSDLFSKVDFLTLDTPGDILIGKADKIVESSGKFFLKSNAKIFIFDNTGNYLSKIDQKGDGPEQYISITDFLVDSIRHQVEILDNHKLIVSSYDFSGRYIESWRHGLIAFQFSKVDDNKYMFYTDKEMFSQYNGRFLLFDRSKSKVVSYYLPINKQRVKYEAFMDVNNFFASKGELLLSCSGNDTIFRLTNNRVVEKYIFSFIDNSMKDESYEKKYESIVDFNNERIKRGITGLYYTAFFDNDNLMISQIVSGKSVLFFWYKKGTKSFKLIDRMEDDFTFRGKKVYASDLFPTFFGEERALRVLEPEYILNPLDSIRRSLGQENLKEYYKNNPSVRRLAENVSVNSNPIIQLLTYRK